MALRPGRPSARGLIDAHAGAAGTLGARAGGGTPIRGGAWRLILGTSSSCMALADGPRCRRDLGAAFRGADPRSMAHRRRTVGVRRRDRSSPAAASGFCGLSARAGPQALAALEKDIVARAGGLSRAALIAEGLHVLPDFIGARSPLADAGARGAVMGMDLREDLRACRTLCRRSLRARLWPGRHREQARGVGLRIQLDQGGRRRRGARRIRCQIIMADVCNKTVESPESPEPVLLASRWSVRPGRRRWPRRCRRCRRSRQARQQAGAAIAAFRARKRPSLNAASNRTGNS